MNSERMCDMAFKPRRGRCSLNEHLAISSMTACAAAGRLTVVAAWGSCRHRAGRLGTPRSGWATCGSELARSSAEPCRSRPRPDDSNQPVGGIDSNDRHQRCAEACVALWPCRRNQDIGDRAPGEDVAE